MRTYQTQLPQMPAWDVLVCGAGPSGIAAAVTAAGQGLKTALLERYGVVGGNLTLGNVTTIMGAVAPGTISARICRLLNAPNGGTAIDPEFAKQELTRLLEEAGVRLFLQTPAVDCAVEEGVIKGIVAATPSGLAYFPAGRVIDATGDGYVAAAAGAPVMMGRDGDGLVQPVSLMYHIDGVEPGVTLACRHEEDRTVLPDGREYLQMCREAARSGALPPNVTIVRLYPTLRPGEYLVNATQENGIDITRPGDLEKAEYALRRQIELVNEFLRTQVPGFKHIRTRISASTMGVRESRRIRGQYVLHDDDLVSGRRFDDVVVHNANFVIDIHNPVGGGQAETEGCPHKAQLYDIPMRSLQPLKVENLILCGRCISGTHRAHASYRVMNIAMALGQAAGMMAASSIAGGIPVAQLDAKDIQKRLETAGCVLFA